MKKSIAFHLGWYVGEYIVTNYLPTLSVDYIKTKKNISVTCAEGDEYRRLEKIWSEHPIKDEEGRMKLFENLREYHTKLTNKYIPSELKCYLYSFDWGLNETEILDFKEGVSSSLWDCDCCYYDTKVENIVFKDGIVILKREPIAES